MACDKDGPEPGVKFLVHLLPASTSAALYRSPARTVSACCDSNGNVLAIRDMVDHPQQGFIGLQKRAGPVEVGRRDREQERAGSIAETSRTVAGQAMTFIDDFAPRNVSRIFLREKARRRGKAD